MSKLRPPPYIATQGLRLWNRTLAEFFESGLDVDSAEQSLKVRERRPGSAEPDTTEQDDRWRPVTRDELVGGVMTLPEVSLRRVVVVVDSGRGKTTLLRRLAMEFKRHRRWDVRQSLPVRLEVSELPESSKSQRVSDEQILKCVLQKVREGIPELSEKKVPDGKALNWLRQLREKGQLVLLVDALDQSEMPQLWTLRRMLDGSMPDWNACRIVVTGRPPAVSSLKNLFLQHGRDWQLIRLEPFTEAEQKAFLGEARWEKIPPEARLLLETPRICEYVRKLRKSKLSRLRTPSDVYYGSLRSMIAGGLKAAVARTFGPGRTEIDKLAEMTADLKDATAKPDLSSYTKQIDAALCLLSAMAFEMICLSDPNSGNLRNHIGSKIYDRFLQRVQRRVRNCRGCGWKDETKFAKDVQVLNYINANKLDFWLYDDGTRKRQGLRFRDATVKEFLAAYWCSKHGTEIDARNLDKWVYLVRSLYEVCAQYRWFWRYLCEMPKAGRKAKFWLRCIEPLWRPSLVGKVSNLRKFSTSKSGAKTWRPDVGLVVGNDSNPSSSDSNVYVRRSCEMMYRSWQTLDEYRKQEHPEAEKNVDAFLSEFIAILNTDTLDRAKIAAQLVPVHVLKTLVTPKRFKQIRPPAEEPAFVRCPPLDVEEAERKEHGGIIPPQGLHCYTFHMGTDARIQERHPDLEIASDECLRHRVRLREPFDFQATTVSREQFRLFDPSHDVDSEEYLNNEFTRTLDCPIHAVSWYQSWCFALWCGMSLPTEVEWEFAVRAGRDGEADFFPTGETISSFQANIDGTIATSVSREGPRLNETVPVRSRRPPVRQDLIERVGHDVLQLIDYQPNRWGVFHPSDNISVWCLDWFSEGDFPRRKASADIAEMKESDEMTLIDDPPRPQSGISRSIRGGFWDSRPVSCYVARRHSALPDEIFYPTGIRLVHVCCERSS